MLKPSHANGPAGSKSHQLFLLLKDAITSGSLSAGSKIPGELKLAEEHQVSRVTVRRALDALEKEDLIIRKRGVGTLVCERPVSTTVMTANFSDLIPNIVKLGENSSVRLLEFSYAYPSDNIKKCLRLEPNERVQKSIRVRLAEDKPFSYLTTYVPERISLSYNESELKTMPLFALLERSGVNIDHATQSISAVLATKNVADALDVAVGTALISLTRLVYDNEEKGVEYLHALYRPDRYLIEMDLFRTGNGNDRYWRPLTNEKTKD